MLKQIGKVLGSQIGLALVGLASIPVLARNYQASLFGEFSLFLLLLTVTSYVDFARSLLVQSYSHELKKKEVRNHSFVIVSNVLSVFAAASIAGTVLLPAVATIGLIVASVLHAVASPYYAAIAVDRGAGDLHLVRNVWWAIAYIVILVGSFFTESMLVYVSAFSGANLAILATYFLMFARSGRRKLWSSLLIERPSLQSARDALSVLSFNVVAALASSVDKVVLERFASPVLYGIYMAQATLALRANMVGTSLGQAAYPHFAEKVRDLNTSDAREYFARTLCFAWLAIGLVLIIPTLFSVELISVLLGEEYVLETDVFGFVLIGVLIQSAGMIITPWQRANGDFRTSRNAVVISATLMMIAATWLIPEYGVIGAVIVYLTGRTAELYLFAHELPVLIRTKSFRRFSVFCAFVLAGLVAAVLKP